MSRRSKRQAEAPMSFFSFQDIISCTTGILVLIALLLTLELVTRTRRADAQPPDVPDISAKDVEEAVKKRDKLREDIVRARTELDKLSRGPITKQEVDALRDRVEVLRDTNTEQTIRVNELQAEHDTHVQEIADAKTAVDELTDEIQKLKQELAQAKKKVKVTLLRGEASRKKPLLVEVSLKEVRVGEVLPTKDMKEIKQFRGDKAIEEFFGWAVTTRDGNSEYFVLLMRPDATGMFLTLKHNLENPDRKYNKTGFELGWDVWPAENSLFGEP